MTLPYEPVKKVSATCPSSRSNVLAGTLLNVRMSLNRMMEMICTVNRDEDNYFTEYPIMGLSDLHCSILLIIFVR